MKGWKLEDIKFSEYEKVMLLANEVKCCDIVPDPNDDSQAELFLLFKNTPRGKYDSIILPLVPTDIPNEETGWLIKEHEAIQEWGRHWDNLRWNVSKWFLGIQTIFFVIAAKGLEILIIDNTTVDHKDYIVMALLALSGCCMIACVIWAIRNLGIHYWHRMAIRRKVMIELDPRIRAANAFRMFSSIPIPFTTGEKDTLKKKHSTGQIESWGPPFCFHALWAAVALVALLVAFPTSWNLDAWKHNIPVFLIAIISSIEIYRFVIEKYSKLPTMNEECKILDLQLEKTTSEDSEDNNLA